MTGIFMPARLMLATLLFGVASLPLSAEPLLPDSAQLGPRPYYLVDKLERGKLKRELSACAQEIDEYEESDFSIGHRGAPLQFPEHTRESYIAAAQMGAGILECDVTFTKDLELVCRHAQCDLHDTTNILVTDLADQCTGPFVPAMLDDEGNIVEKATARCCTSDITLEQFLSLEGKMDAGNAAAQTPEEYISTRGTPDFRTDLYTTGGTLLSHEQSIELFQELNRKFTPELKSPQVTMPFNGFTQEGYAQKMIDEYIAAGVPPEDVWPQSFNLADVLYWIAFNPDYGKQAVYLDGSDPVNTAANPPKLQEFENLKAAGVNILAPSMALLVEGKPNGKIRPTRYAKRARKAGLELISWTTERSGRINEDVIPADGAFYYDTSVDVLKGDGDILKTIDVLVQKVGIFGLFSDWPATTTFYANCKDIPALAAMDGDYLEEDIEDKDEDEDEEEDDEEDDDEEDDEEDDG